MPDILVKYDEPITSANGDRYFAQAVGKEVAGGQWEGWLEFVSTTDAADTVASGRETTQPNRVDLEYWAQGLTRVYLQGALSRAISSGSVSGQPAAAGSEAPHLSAAGAAIQLHLRRGILRHERSSTPFWSIRRAKTSSDAS